MRDLESRVQRLTEDNDELRKDLELAKREMEENHPQVQEPALPEGEHSAAAITLTSSQVFKAIWGFKAGTAPGPSGLRGEHLKEAKAVRTEHLIET